MRITEVHDGLLNVSRYRDPTIASGGLTTSVVTVHTDVVRDGAPVVGYGYASVGRYAQNGLMRERFAPRLLGAPAHELRDETGNLDPLRAWHKMMAGEKPGGHGERCVAVGTLDMALWDAAAKIAGVPLHRHIAERLGRSGVAGATADVRCYASGGYLYPDDDLRALAAELDEVQDLGFTHVKMKIGQSSLRQDLRRVEQAVASIDGSRHVAVDAMNRYDADTALAAAQALRSFDLWWFEDVCDPLDFATHACVAERYDRPIATGEALFSTPEAVLLDQHAGLRRELDVLVFDPVHCYGLPGYLEILSTLTAAGWPLSAFWPHGGQLFSLHVVAALGLAGVEMTPLAFHPFHGPPRDLMSGEGRLTVPDLPGIGFEMHDPALRVFRSLADEG